LILGLLLFCIKTYAQDLENQFNVISANNDMMGGSVVVFCEDGIIENLVIGKSDFQRDINVTEDTKYRIASISKTITAIAIMQLVEQGLLDLDVDISNILDYEVQNPNFPDSPITTRMLLSHTSSIIDGPTYGSFITASVINNPIPGLNEILTPDGTYYSSSQFNNTLPGTYFNYSNINYVILGTIVEKISDVRFDIYCKQNISEPLGIDASFNVNDLQNINQLAVLYRKTGGIWTPQADNYQGVQPIFNNLTDYRPGTNAGRFGPQGSFRCSAKDLAKIFLVLMNGGTYDGANLLSESSCSTMLANEWTYDGNNGNNYFGLYRSWGLGIHRTTATPGGDIVLPGSNAMFGHLGEAYGLVSDAYFDTERKVGLVFMTNGVGTGYQLNDFSVYYTIEQEIFNAIENHVNIEDCSQSIGVDQFEAENIPIYPNPSSDVLNIPECLSKNGCKIEIFSVSGKKLKTIYQNSKDTQIEIQELKTGIYILRIDGLSYKFIKQ
jgi:CubicO group peptidase (beta-lactamase class C family)